MKDKTKKQSEKDEKSKDDKDYVQWTSEMEMIDNHIITNPKKERAKPELKEDESPEV